MEILLICLVRLVNKSPNATKRKLKSSVHRLQYVKTLIELDRKGHIKRSIVMAFLF